MGNPTVFRIVFQIGKIGSFLIFLLPYIQWKTWRARSAFKDELLKNGLSEEHASNLADFYGNGNKNLLVSVLRQSSK